MRAGIAGQHGTDLGLRRILIGPAQLRQFDMELAAMRGEGILAGFGAADLMRNRGDFGQRQEVMRDVPAEVAHRRYRGPGRPRNLSDIVAFAKGRQQFGTEQRQAQQRRRADQR